LVKVGRLPALFISALLASVGASPSNVFAQAASAEQTQYDGIINAGRSGRHDEAISALRTWLATHPADRRARADMIVMLGWAGQDANAVAAANEVGLSTLEGYALRSAAKSGRNMSNYVWAEAAYAAALKLDPADCDALLGIAYTLADARNSSGADVRLTQFDTRCALLNAQRATEGARARTYWAQRQIVDGQPNDLDALGWWTKRLTQEERAPAKADAPLAMLQRAQYQEAVLLATKVGAFHLVEVWLPRVENTLSENDRARVLASMAAQKIRWAANTSDAERKRWQLLLDDALRQLNQASSLATEASLKRMILADTIAALGELGDFERALSMAEQADQTTQTTQTTQTKAALPAYAEVVVADALMRANQPYQAEQRLRRVLAEQQVAGEAMNRDVSIAIFYTLIDQGKYDEARTWIEAAAKLVGPIAYRGLPGVEMEDSDYVRFQLARALLVSPSKGYREFQRAEVALSRILKTGPFNVSARLDQADWQNARGWPRAAAKSVALVESDESGNLRAIEFRARLGLDTGDFAGYREAYAELTRLDAHPIMLRRVREAYEREFGNVVTFGVTRGRSADSAADTGSSDMEADVSLMSALMLQYWRLKARWRTSEATFAARNESSNFFALGARLHRPYWWLDMEATQRANSSEGAGLRLAGSLQLVDGLTSRFAAATRSEDLPLRGQAAGVSARSVQASLNWRALAQTNIGVGGSRLVANDGNVRTELNARVDHAVSLADQWIASIRLEIDRSTNRLSQVAYFSPRRQESAGFSVGLAHTLLQAGARSWTHQLNIGIGRLAQEGFTTAQTQSASYEHDWRWGASGSIGASVGQSRRPYDGVESRRTTFSIRLNWAL
jgi:biofilm PGA synthesis protein PgaA